MATLNDASRKHYLTELRAARAAALADAEAFDQILFGIERLGAHLNGKVESLGKYRLGLRDVAASAESAWEMTDGVAALKFDRVFDLVQSARNDALHQGAAARHVTTQCVELALMLEDGLMVTGRRVKDFMVDGPMVAKSFEPLASVRRTLLLNSFSYLPVFIEEQWKLIHDAKLVVFLRAAASGNDRNRLLGTSVEVAHATHGLCMESVAAFCHADDHIESVLAGLNSRPILVVRHQPAGADDLQAILTPFDLL